MKTVDYSQDVVDFLENVKVTPIKKPGRDKEIVIRTSTIAAALGAFIATRFGLGEYEQILSAGIGVILAELYDRAAFTLKTRLKVK